MAHQASEREDGLRPDLFFIFFYFLNSPSHLIIGRSFALCFAVVAALPGRSAPGTPTAIASLACLLATARRSATTDDRRRRACACVRRGCRRRATTDRWWTPAEWRTEACRDVKCVAEGGDRVPRASEGGRHVPVTKPQEGNRGAVVVVVASL